MRDLVWSGNRLCHQIKEVPGAFQRRFDARKQPKVEQFRHGTVEQGSHVIADGGRVCVADPVHKTNFGFRLAGLVPERLVRGLFAKPAFGDGSGLPE